MANRQLVGDRKNELLDAIGKQGYVVEVTSKRPSIIRIQGKNGSIRCNLKCTRKKVNLPGFSDAFWFGITKRVLFDVDYVILAPVNFFGFYIIPVPVFKDNLQTLFHNQIHENIYTFTLNAGEEVIFGYSSENSISLTGMYGIVTESELTRYEAEKAELPFFPEPNHTNE